MTKAMFTFENVLLGISEKVWLVQVGVPLSKGVVLGCIGLWNKGKINVGNSKRSLEF